MITITIELLMIIFVFNFETPKFLLEKDREQDCIELLKIIYKEEYV